MTSKRWAILLGISGPVACLGVVRFIQLNTVEYATDSGIDEESALSAAASRWAIVALAAGALAIISLVCFVAAYRGNESTRT
jgi:hypothetical protein